MPPLLRLLLVSASCLFAARSAQCTLAYLHTRSVAPPLVGLTYCFCTVQRLHGSGSVVGPGFAVSVATLLVLSLLDLSLPAGVARARGVESSKQAARRRSTIFIIIRGFQARGF